jgi:hypothetical protein
MSDAARADETWTPWRVVPDSGFEVDDPTGSVGIVQIDHKRFLVQHRFRFSNPEIEAYLTRKLVERGMAEPEALVTVEDARTFTPSEDNPTDLASIPRYMRWFENPYGKHSLAALIHDELITKEVNGGRLGSDTLADRFFREMMKTSGVPWLKRWIMWAAVAARSRLVAGGLRTASMIAWIGLCVVGLACVVAAFGSWIFGWSVPIDPWWLLVIATALPIVAARLWGEQWGASIVFAVAAFWIVPAGAVAGLGYLVYLSLEHLAVRAGYE